MLMRNHLALCAAIASMGLALAACGQQQAPRTQGPGTSAQAAEGGDAVAAGLKITNWGPQSTTAGQVFNAQANGEAALWIRLNQSMDGGSAALEFNGTLLPATVSGNLITAAIPSKLYAVPGNYTVHVIVRNGSKSVQSDGVTFAVK